MATGTHTPGPWEFRMYADGCRIVSTHDRPGSTVRDSLKGVTVIVDATIHDDQGNANEASPDARLIAAAPELLEACKAQHDAIDTLLAMLIERDPDFYPSKSVVWPKLLKGNAAIAKAEGKA